MSVITKELSGLIYISNASIGKAVEIKLATNKLLAFSENEEFEVDLSKASFSLGGENSRYLVIKESTFTLFLNPEESINELIKFTDGPNLLELESIKNNLIKNKKNKTLVPLYITGFTAVSLVSLIVAFFIFLQAFTSFAVKSIPLNTEEWLGNLVFSSMTKGKTIDNKQLLDSVKEIGETLNNKSNNSDYKFKFYLVKDDQVNAFALPGGYVVVNTGLLKKADSPEEVAGVLAHELQHVYQRHGLKRIIKRFGISLSIGFLFGNIGSTVDAIGGELTGLKFDRDEEREADKLGLELMYNSGIDPNGMVSFFKKLQKIEGSLPNALTLISTHPDTEERIKNLQTVIDDRYRINYKIKKEFKFDWKKLKEEAEKF